MTSHGKGISLIPQLPFLDSFPIQVTRVRDLTEPCVVFLAWRKEGQMTEAAEAFLEFCRKYSRAACSSHR